MTYGLFLWLASLGASIEATIGIDASPAAGDWIEAAFSGGLDATLRLPSSPAARRRPRLRDGGEPARPDDARRAGAEPPAPARPGGALKWPTPPRRLVSAEKRPEDETALRPQVLADFTGQEAARKNLKVFIESAKSRGEALDHVLFVGPPGLGKTTLAQIVARELGVNFRSTSGPVIAKAGDLAAQLTNLEPRDVLFIDEIHRLNPAVEEILYPAMEDFQLDLIIGDGPAARSVKIDLAQFTPDRRDDARRAADDAVARPLRHSRAAQFLHRRRNWRASCGAARG